MHSKQDIENAARFAGLRVEPTALASGVVFVAPVDSGENAECEWIGLRKWQPWADTEAGQSDALVLDTAVRVWEYNSLVEGRGVPHNLNMLLNEMHIAARRPWVKDRQAATFAAAAAIGAHMKGVE